MKSMRDKLKLLSVKESPPPESTPSAAPPWVELPLEVTANILRRLDVFEILECAQLVCTTWWRVCQDPATWRVIKIVDDDLMPQDCTIMCRRAVDRSQGQLVDLTVAYFGDDDLLLHIANRSSHLKRLTLAFHPEMNASVISLSEAVKKLPELEELHLIISSISYFGSSGFEPFTAACSTLTSFSIDERGSGDFGLFYHGPLGDFETPLSLGSAAAIGRNIPNLCHLGLLGINLNNEWLEALLDGCPGLESLDLRGCSGVDLGGALGERCRFQIQNLRLPSDSGDDCEMEMKPFDYSAYIANMCDCIQAQGSPESDSDFAGYFEDVFYG